MLPPESLDAQLLRALRQLLVALEHRLATRALHSRARAIANDDGLAEEAARAIADNVLGDGVDVKVIMRPEFVEAVGRCVRDKAGDEAAKPQRCEAADAGAATNGNLDVDTTSTPALLEREHRQPLKPEDAMRVDAPTDYEVRQWLQREQSGKALRSQQFAKVAEELLERREREDRDRKRADARAKAKKDSAHG